MGRLSDWFAREKKKVGAMPKKQAVRYIWDYYKLWLISITAILAIIIFVIVRLVTNIPENWLYVVFANTRAEAATGSQLWKDFEERQGYDLKKKNLIFDDACYFDFLQNEARGNNYFNAFVALVESGTLDAITMEPDSLAALGQTGRLLDLRADQSYGIMKKYEDRFIYYTPPEGSGYDEPIPVGIDISDSLLVTKYHLYSEKCALGVGAASKNIEAVDDFLQFVLGG